MLETDPEPFPESTAAPGHHLAKQNQQSSTSTRARGKQEVMEQPDAVYAQEKDEEDETKMTG